MDDCKLIEYVDEFAEALKAQLKHDHERWGDTWRHRSCAGQEERIIETFNDYFDQYRYANQPINWLKVAGNALICWVREMHPETSFVD